MKRLYTAHYRLLGRFAAYVASVFLIGILLGLAFQRLHPLVLADNWLYRAIYLGPHADWVEYISRPFNYNLLFETPLIPQKIPTFFYFMVLFAAIYLGIKERAKVWWFLGSALLGNLLVHAFTMLAVEIAYRQRPFVALDIAMNQRDYDILKEFSSFPSGHTRDTALYATLITLYIPALRWPAIILILFVGYTRVYLGAHYGSDVLIGMGVGIGVAYAIWNLTQGLRMLRDSPSTAKLGGDS